MQHEGKLISHRTSLGFLALRQSNALYNIRLSVFFSVSNSFWEYSEGRSARVCHPLRKPLKNEGTMAGNTDLEDGTCGLRKVPAGLWWNVCEDVCSLAGSPYPTHIIKHSHSLKNLLLLILWKRKIPDSVTLASVFRGALRRDQKEKGK